MASTRWKVEILFLMILFFCSAVYLTVYNFRYDSVDLAPLYVAAQLVVDGKSPAIYDHHPFLFNIVPPGEFKETTKKIGFKGSVTPYVHLPLFSFLLLPLVLLPYHIITKFMLFINFLAIILSLHLILKLMGIGFKPSWFITTLLAITFFYPTRYSLRLGQTSPLVFLGISSIFYLTKTGSSKISGFILGGLISLKITPILFLLYFLIKKKWSLVISSVITLMVIGVCSVLTMGWESNITFFHTISRLNGVSLASWNNQSLDAFLLRWVTYASHLYDWHLIELSFKMKVVKYGVLLGMLLVWLFILLQPRGVNEEEHALIDFSLTLILSIFFAPLAWSHYLLFLTFPYGVLLSTLILNPTIPYRNLMITGIIFSYIGAALPPSFFLALVNFSLTSKIPLPLLSSAGFLAAIVLLIIILMYKIVSRKRLEDCNHCQ